MSRRWILAASILAIIAGFFVMWMSQTWSLHTTFPPNSSGAKEGYFKMGYLDTEQKQAYAQLSQCLMFGGTLAFVLVLTLPRGGREQKER